MRGFPSKLKQFWDSVERLRRASGLEHGDIANLLMVTDRHYSARYKLNEFPRTEGILSFTKYFHLDPRTFLRTEIDWPSVIKRVQRNSVDLPERYSKGAFSRRRTSLHILNYLDRVQGKNFVHAILDEFDVNEAAFADPDAYISVQFLTDLANRVVALGATRRMLFDMGAESARINKNIGFSKNILDALEIKDACAFQADHLMGYFDKNYRYRTSKLTDTVCTIEARQSAEVLDALSVKRHGNQNVCGVKAGVAGSFPEFFGLPTAAVRETKCVHRGDSACIYEVDFSAAAHYEKTGRRIRLLHPN